MYICIFDVLLCIYILYIFTKQRSTFLGIQDKHGHLQFFSNNKTMWHVTVQSLSSVFEQTLN